MDLLQLVVSIDVSIMQFIVENRTPFLTKLMKSMSGLGTAATTGSFLAVFYLAGWRREFWNAGIAHFADAAVVAVLMDVVNRGFPSDPVCQTSFDPVATSFPSGHAAAGMVFAYVAWRSDNMPFLPVLLLALGMSVSRVYLGTHHVSDTVFGVFLGLGLAAATYRYGIGDKVQQWFETSIEPVLKLWLSKV